MTMKEVVNKVRTLLDAGTGTYLANAIVLRDDAQTTDRGDLFPVIRVIPLPSEDAPMHIGPDGWYGRFRVHILANYPAKYDNGDKHYDLLDEMLQIVADNRAWLNGSSQQAALKSFNWDFGYDANGLKSERAVHLLVEYEAEGATPA